MSYSSEYFSAIHAKYFAAKYAKHNPPKSQNEICHGRVSPPVFVAIRSHASVIDYSSVVAVVTLQVAKA